MIYTLSISSIKPMNLQINNQHGYWVRPRYSETYVKLLCRSSNQLPQVCFALTWIGSWVSLIGPTHSSVAETCNSRKERVLNKKKKLSKHTEPYSCEHILPFCHWCPEAWLHIVFHFSCISTQQNYKTRIFLKTTTLWLRYSADHLSYSIFPGSMSSPGCTWPFQTSLQGISRRVSKDSQVYLHNPTAGASHSVQYKCACVRQPS